MDLAAASAFLAGHARQLDRLRFAALLGAVPPDAVLAAVAAYRNPDGGYGWGLEPDLRAPESQPGGALHALEVFAEVAPTTTPAAAQLCDWLARVALPGGGLPFAFPVADPAACAPFWVDADPSRFSLQSTAFVVGTALRVAAHDPAVADHPWLRAATRTCLDAIARLDTAPHPIALSFVVRLVDALADADPGAGAILERLGAFLPRDGTLHVTGGAADEYLRPLDFAPTPGPARGLLDAAAVDADLERLAGAQQPDGGWVVDFGSFSPAAALEWRGYATVRAVGVLRANGILT
ncbi:MAG: hypothetical protein AB7G09_24330 [Pseudonocardia sp.]